MTSISGSMSPADRIQQMLQSAVTSGTVKSADQSALSSAITDIDSALQSGASTSLKPGDMKSKVDSLVDQEVTDGKLTSDQADELKQVFAQASQHAMGHHHGGLHVKASDDSAITDITGTDATTTSTSAGTSTSGTDSLTSSIENLIGFLKKLETATSSSTNYTASGASAGGTAQNLLANLFA